MDWTCVSCIAGRFFPTEPPGKLLFLTPGLTQLLPKLQGCPNHPGHSCPHHSPAHYLILCFSTILNRVYLFKLTHSTSLASIYKNEKQGTSLVVQRFRTCLLMQGIQIQSLVQELRPPHATGQLSPWAITREAIATRSRYTSPHTATSESPHRAMKTQGSQK